MIENKRLISLDAFRGLTIVFMLIVNNAGDWDHVYGQLEHAAWNGCTAADMIFPFFVFIMGVAMPLGMLPQLEKKVALGKFANNILRRSVILFGLGVVLSAVAYWSYRDSFRLMGVLQRLAVTYLFMAMILLFNKRVLEIALFWILLIVSASALIFYAQNHGDLSLLFPIYYNLADLVDTRLLGTLNHAFDKTLFLGHDPEGFFGTIASISSGVAGIFCGRIFLENKLPMKKFWKILFFGLALIILGVFSQKIIPFNKNLWTSSYVIFSSGWAFLVMSIFYYLIDIKNVLKPFYLFIAYGSNAIVSYFLVSFLAMITVGIKWIGPTGEMIRLKNVLYQATYATWFSPIFGDYFSSALWGITYVVLFFFVVDWMYRKKLFVKI